MPVVVVDDLGDWNGAGAHCNYSTRSMREVGLGGMKEIERAIELLKEHHAEHIERYGSGNERRLTGKHETAAMSDFTWGVADRGASIRVGNETFTRGAGYMEDRRPAANMDPYVVTSMLAQTTLLSTSSTTAGDVGVGGGSGGGGGVGGDFGAGGVVDGGAGRGDPALLSTTSSSTAGMHQQTNGGLGGVHLGGLDGGGGEVGGGSSSRGGDIVGGLTGAMAAAGIGGDPFLADDADSSASSSPAQPQRGPRLAPHSYTGGV